MLTALFFIILESASAQSFYNPWTQAKVLNPGQSHWGIDTTYESARKKNGFPSTQVTSTWAQLLQKSKSAQQTAALEAKRAAAGQDLDDAAAVTKYELYQEITTMHFGWAYGIYKRWMIGIDLPVAITKQDIRAKSEGPAGAEATTTAQQQLTDLGIYGDRTQYSEQRVGDVSLLSQVQLLTLSRWTFAFQQQVGLPTSSQPDERNLFMTRAGNGQPNFGGRLMATWQQQRTWQLNTSVGYRWQVTDQVRVRLPDANGDVTGDIESGVSRNLGDVMDAQVEGIWRTGTFDWVTGYRILHKEADRYQGTFVEQARYDELGANTAWTRQLVSLGALYYIGNRQRAGVRDGYSVLVAGHWPIQEQSPLWSLDLRMMF